MKLNRNQISNIQQTVWKLEESVRLLKAAGFNKSDMTVKKIQGALDELNYELLNYELIPA